MIKSIHWDLPEYTCKQTHNKYCKSQSVTSNFHMHSVSLHFNILTFNMYATADTDTVHTTT